MTETIFAKLRQLLVEDYSGLKERLTRRFGSADFASEVLHEAWMRLDATGSTPPISTLRNPGAYLYRVALNVATDQKRTDQRWLRKVEIEAIHRRALDELDPGRIAEARLELAALIKAINTLEPRRRAVFIAVRVDHLPYKMIAARLGITVRVVDRELRLALDQLGEVLNEPSMADRGLDRSEPRNVAQSMRGRLRRAVPPKND